MNSANDQAQPRRVSGVGWSAGLGGWLAAAVGIVSGLTQSVQVLLLLLHVEGHEPGGIMVKTRRDAVPHFPNLVDYRITLSLSHCDLPNSSRRTPTLTPKDRHGSPTKVNRLTTKLSRVMREEFEHASVSE